MFRCSNTTKTSYIGIILLLMVKLFRILRAKNHLLDSFQTKSDYFVNRVTIDEHRLWALRLLLGVVRPVWSFFLLLCSVGHYRCDVSCSTIFRLLSIEHDCTRIDSIPINDQYISRRTQHFIKNANLMTWRRPTLVRNLFLEGVKFMLRCVSIYFHLIMLVCGTLYSSAIRSERKLQSTCHNTSSAWTRRTENHPDYPERDDCGIIFWTGRGTSTTVHCIPDGGHLRRGGKVRDKQRQRCLCFWTRSNHRQRCLCRRRGLWTLETGRGFHGNGAFGLVYGDGGAGWPIIVYQRQRCIWIDGSVGRFSSIEGEKWSYFQFYSHLQLVCRTQFSSRIHRWNRNTID